jgi:hypothetical protein
MNGSDLRGSVWRASRSYRSRCLVCVVWAMTLPSGCDNEGAGSIHVDRSFKSQVMVVPDRKAPGPPLPKAKARRGQPASESRNPSR